MHLLNEASNTLSSRVEFKGLHSFSNFRFLNRIQNSLSSGIRNNSISNNLPFLILSRDKKHAKASSSSKISRQISNTDAIDSLHDKIKRTNFAFKLRGIASISLLHLGNLILNNGKTSITINKSRFQGSNYRLNDRLSLLILKRVLHNGNLSLVNLLIMHLLDKASDSFSSRIEFKGLTILLRRIQLILDFRINLAVVAETNRNQTIFSSSLCANDKFSQGSNLILSDVITRGFDICNLESSTLVFELFNSRSNNTSSLFLLHVARLNLPHCIHNTSQQFIEFDGLRGKLLDHSFSFFNGIHLCINGQSSSLNERSCILLGICKDAFHSRSHCHYITSFL